MKVLVTGGAGFVGSHIVDRLVKEGHWVRVLDNLDPQVHANREYSVNEDVEFIYGDIRDTSTITAAIKDIEVIFHEAAAVGVGQSMYQIGKYVDVNSLGTARLLDVLVNTGHRVKKLIVASSMSLYGEGAYMCENCGIVHPAFRPEKQLAERQWEMKCPGCGIDVKAGPTDETKQLNPTSVYAMTKKSQEEMCLAIGRIYGIPTVALRYFNIYGPGQSLSNPYTGICAIFSSRIKNDKPPILFEDGMQSRDFVSVHDIVEANILAMKCSSADYESFNVGTGKATSIQGVASLLTRLYHKDVGMVIANKYRKGDIRHCYADISKIKNMLGFTPRVSLLEGLAELVYWGERAEAIDNFLSSYDELLVKGLVAK